MKQFYFLILISIFGKTISAQQYYPMLDSSINEWSYTNFGIGVIQNPSFQSLPCNYPAANTPGWPYKEFTTSDTIIGSNIYKVIYNDFSYCTLGYIREDTATKKIFFLDNASSTEKLLYDFSMVVGDTITCNFNPSFSGYVSGLYTLDSITMIQIDAGPRRQFWFACYAIPGSLVLSWVESVGCLSYMPYPHFVNQYMFQYFSSCPGTQHIFDQFMTCFNHGTRVYSDSCAYAFAQTANYTVVIDSCDYFCFLGAINEMSSISSITIFPNPSNSKTTISLDVKQKDEFSILIYDITGKKLLKEIYLGKIPEGKKENDLDLSFLSNGIYLLECKGEKGSVYDKLLIHH